MKKIIIICIILLISISPLSRGLFYNYETFAFLTLLALFEIAYLFVKIVKREPMRLNKLFMIASLLLLAAISFSFTGALNPRENLETLLLYTELTITYIVLFDYFSDKQQNLMYYVMLPSVIVGFVCAVVGLMSLTRKFDFLEVTTMENRIGSTFQYSNTAAIYFIVCLIFALVLSNDIKNFILKAVIAGAGNILLFSFFLTGSRGGFLIGMIFIVITLVLQPIGRRISGALTFLSMTAPVFIVLKSFNESTAAHSNADAAKWLAVSFVLAAVLAAFSSLLIYLLSRLALLIGTPKKSKVKLPLYIYIGALILVAIFVYIFRRNLIGLLPDILVTRLIGLVNEGFRTNNVAARLIFYKDAMKLISDNWLSGLGGNGWDAAYRSVQDFNYTASYVHCSFLQVFVDNGIIAFVAFTALIVIAVVRGIRSYISQRDIAFRTLSSGLICGLLALVLHSALDFDLSYVSLLLLMWMMLAAASIGPKISVVEEGTIKPKSGLLGRSVIDISSAYLKIILVIICAALFSTHAVYFAGAYNRQAAFEYMQQKDYKNAMVYYEEAAGLDPANTDYTFQLAKLYHYFGMKSNVPENRQLWLEKAREAGEISVAGNTGYPDYMYTLVRIYLDSGMPVEALQQAQELVTYQKYNAEVYELLAESYLAAYDHYIDNGDSSKAEEMLAACIDIDDDPYLHRSVKMRAADFIGSGEIIAQYQHSEKLKGYLDRAHELF